jgi:hypothetical protein
MSFYEDDMSLFTSEISILFECIHTSCNLNSARCTRCASLRRGIMEINEQSGRKPSLITYTLSPKRRFQYQMQLLPLFLSVELNGDACWRREGWNGGGGYSGTFSTAGISSTWSQFPFREILSERERSRIGPQQGID